MDWRGLLLININYTDRDRLWQIMHRETASFTLKNYEQKDKDIIIKSDTDCSLFYNRNSCFMWLYFYRNDWNDCSVRNSIW